MRNDGVLDALTLLLGADPDVADRDEIGAMIRRNAQIRGWVDAADVRLTRRLKQLEAEGKSENAGMAFTDEGRRCGKEAKATENREEICSEFPALEDALALGAVSADHLDVLARLTRNLSDVERSDLHAVADDIVDSATTDYVSEFERKTRNIIDDIRNTHAPQDEAAELDRQRAESSIKSWVDKTSGMHKTLIECDPIRDAAVHAAIDAQLARLKQLPEYAETPFGSLQVDALVDAVSSDQPGQPRIPEVSMLIDQHSACHGRHADTICETSAGAPLPVSTAQRLCAATPPSSGSHSAPTAKSSTSVANSAPPPERNVERSGRCTATAHTRTAPSASTVAESTTSSRGRSTGAPTSTTCCHCASATITWSTKATGNSR